MTGLTLVNQCWGTVVQKTTLCVRGLTASLNSLALAQADWTCLFQVETKALWQQETWGLGKRYHVIQEITQHLIKHSVHVTHVHAQVCTTFTTHNTTFTAIILPSSTTGLLTEGGGELLPLHQLYDTCTHTVG